MDDAVAIGDDDPVEVVGDDLIEQYASVTRLGVGYRQKDASETDFEADRQNGAPHEHDVPRGGVQGNGILCLQNCCRSFDRDRGRDETKKSDFPVDPSC